MADPHGLLLVDKPRGKTSHDVVAEVRRALSTKRVGHAGTLDPMATGLLLVLVGDATRLAPFLTDADKCYVATLALGVGTASLDADGVVTEQVEVSDELRREVGAAAPGPRVAAAIAHELARTEQIPPLVSAIHVDGERAYARARRGEEIDLPPRPVRLHELRVVGGDGATPSLSIELRCSKGYYVRSLARDLGASLGVPAHLTTLRRTSSGGFDVGDAVPLSPREGLPGALLPVADVLARAMPLAELTEDGARRARQGKALDAGCFEGPMPAMTCAWMHAGVPVAIGDGEGRVIRGFPST